MKVFIFSLGMLTLNFSYASDFKCPDGKTYPVSLTFDDGPAGAKTNKVMDILKEKNVKGTFFVLGDNFDGQEERKNNYPILDRMLKEGHIVGSHTFDHIAHTTVSTDKAINNIDRASALLKGYMSPIVRLPYGDGSFKTSNPAKKAASEKIMNHIKEEGLTHVGWSIDTEDWNVKKRPFVLESMMKQICQTHGGVILFHDIHQNTVDHLAGWIDEIKKAGHTIEPLNYFYKNLPQPQAVKAKSADTSTNCNKQENKPTEVDALEGKIKEIIKKIK
jgi:peptidoglycan/xylan/chitin deacetylase (PgdA/CDA1 family)